MCAAAVAAAHVCFLFAIQLSVDRHSTQDNQRAIQARLISIEKNARPTIEPSISSTSILSNPADEPRMKFQDEPSKPGIVYENPPALDGAAQRIILTRRTTTLAPAFDPEDPAPGIERLCPTSVAHGDREVVLSVLLTIDAEGNVTDARVERSSGIQLLDQSAIDCAKNWTFLPSIPTGAPVRVSTKFTVRL